MQTLLIDTMKKILIIEDEETVRENLMELLEAEDFDVCGAGDGCAGLDLVQQYQPDLILCDVMMPKLDGFGVLNTLRKNPVTATIPFMFLTARTDKTDLRQGMELGADDYITKPFSADELLNAIASRLQKQAIIEEQQSQKLNQLRASISLSLPHEMRSPLTNILGFSQLLVEEADNLERQEIQEMSESIRKSGERLHRLIQNFLLYAELELTVTDPARIQALRSSRVSSAASVIEATVWHQAKRRNRDADVILDIHDSSLQIAKTRLEKIVEELVDNAFKYSPDGTPVSVIGRTVPHQSFYVLSISDRGRGMSPEQIAKLGAYQQFERKLYAQQGTGLGFSISKRLIELLGGTLTIESIPSQHTTVRALIPV